MTLDAKTRDELDYVIGFYEARGGEMLTRKLNMDKATGREMMARAKGLRETLNLYRGEDGEVVER